MTVETDKSYTVHITDGVAVAYNYDFPVQDAATVRVYLSGVLVGPAEYTVTGVGNPDGGTIEFNVAPDGLQQLAILRVVDLTQGIDYDDYDGFPSETHEAGLDKLTLITQQLQEQLDRAIALPPGTPPDADISIPPYDPGKAWLWSEDELKIENSGRKFNDIVDEAEAAAFVAEQQANRSRDYAEDASDSAGLAESARIEATAQAERASSEADRAETAADDAIAEGNTQVARVIAEGDTQEARVIAAGDEAVEARDFAFDWAQEAEDVPVDDGVNPSGFSAYHWAEKAKLAAQGLTFKGAWDPNDGAYPPPPVDGHEAGDLYVVIADGSYDGVDYFIGDWLIRNVANDGWLRYPNVTEWSSILNVPANVVNALNSTGGEMTGPLGVRGVNPQVRFFETDTTDLNFRLVLDNGVLILQHIDDAGAFVATVARFKTNGNIEAAAASPQANQDLANKGYIDAEVADINAVLLALQNNKADITYVDARMPAGSIIMWGTATPPTGWIPADGRATTSYPNLAALFGENVPDLRGEFVRGWDNNRGIDAGRTLASAQLDAMQPITASWAVQNGVPTLAEGAAYTDGAYSTKDGNTGNTGSRSVWKFDSARQVRTAAETRPRNVALMYIIKT